LSLEWEILSVQVNIDVRDVDDFQEKMRLLDESVRQNVQDALVQTAEAISIRAQDLAPVRTGRLISNILVVVMSMWIVRVICRVPYAIFQELGTRYISPRLFMTRAMAEYAPQIMFIIQAALERAASEVSEK
jgi:HK97 gp10 family phage protein